MDSAAIMLCTTDNPNCLALCTLISLEISKKIPYILYPVLTQYTIHPTPETFGAFFLLYEHSCTKLDCLILCLTLSILYPVSCIHHKHTSTCIFCPTSQEILILIYDLVFDHFFLIDLFLKFPSGIFLMETGISVAFKSSLVVFLSYSCKNTPSLCIGHPLHFFFVK